MKKKVFKLRSVDEMLCTRRIRVMETHAILKQEAHYNMSYFKSLKIYIYIQQTDRFLFLPILSFGGYFGNLEFDKIKSVSDRVH